MPGGLTYSAPSRIGPDGSERSFLRVGEVVVEGLDDAFRSEVAAILAPLRGVQVSAATLYEAAGKIQNIYAIHGFFLTRVVIPPQDARDGGKLIFKVAEGFISTVNVEALPPTLRDSVARTLARVIGKPRLTIAEFDRALMLAADMPGLNLQGDLSPAREDFGVTLKITGSFAPVTGDISTDNTMSRLLGGAQTTFSGNFNSPFGLGEQFYISATGASDFGGFGDENPHRLAAFGVIAPLSSDGLKFNLEYAVSTSRPLTPTGLLPTASLYRRFSFKLSYPWIRTATDTLNSHLAFEDTDEINQAPLFVQTLYHDHLEIMRASLDVRRISNFGATFSGSVQVSKGLPIFNARGAAQATPNEPISRIGASDAFAKLEVHGEWVQEAPGGSAFDISGRGQYAVTGPLLNSEKFVIGGPGDLSSYDQGYFSGDGGWVGRAEWQLPLSSARGPRLTPYLFGSRGQVYTLRPTAAESALLGADSIGLGLRVHTSANLAIPNPIDLTVEAARNLIDRSATQPDGWRINMCASVHF